MYTLFHQLKTTNRSTSHMLAAAEARANSNISSFSRGKILEQISEVPNFGSCRIRPTGLKLELKRS